jgi:GNAT superfamily N-acetyltransferase
MGAPSPERIVDGWIWAEFWTRYFTDREPQHTWVVEDTQGGQVVGYLTGTADAARVDRYVPFLLPGIVCRVVRKRLMRRAASRRAVVAMLRSLAAGELDVPPGIRREYPATFHFNLLPPARGRGLGMALYQTFAAKMRSLGVPGVHVQPLSVNEAVARFNRRAGFQLVQVRPTRAFAHAGEPPLAVCTWVSRLDDRSLCSPPGDCTGGSGPR